MMQVEMSRVNWGSPCPWSGGFSQFRCGGLLAELHVREGEIGLSSRTLGPEERSDISSIQPDSKPEWTQWAVCTGGDSIELRPNLPDLSVVAEGDEPFSLEAGETRRIYLRIPVTVVFLVNDSLDEVLAELPSEELSTCRFGEAELSELCYQLPRSLFREGPLSIDEGSIQAPVTIRNESSETLEVSRLCLRLAPLAIYEFNDVLWTNETVVRYQGGTARSRVSVRPGPPVEAPSARLVTPAREKGAFTVVGRTFRSLRNWSSDPLETE